MKARELKDLRANNPQDLVAKLGELKSYENKRSKEIYSPNQNHH